MDATFETLPHEVTRNIYSHVRGDEVVALYDVSKRFRDFSNLEDQYYVKTSVFQEMCQHEPFVNSHCLNYRKKCTTIGGLDKIFALRCWKSDPKESERIDTFRSVTPSVGISEHKVWMSAGKWVNIYGKEDKHVHFRHKVAESTTSNLSVENNIAAIGDCKGTIHFLDSEGQVYKAANAHVTPIQMVEMKNGVLVSTGGGAIKVWKLESILNHTDDAPQPLVTRTFAIDVMGLNVSADTLSYKRTWGNQAPKVYDLNSGRDTTLSGFQERPRQRSDHIALQFMGENELFLCCQNDVQLLDLRTNKRALLWEAPSDVRRFTSIGSDGRYGFLTGTANTGVKLWDKRSSFSIGTVLNTQTTHVKSFDFDSTNLYCAVGNALLKQTYA